jgi:putative addiction module component (TIGR02574 family)
MSSNSRNLEEQAKKLPQKDRARLALTLIESLDPGTDEDAEALWLDEAEKRLNAYDAGKTQSRPVNDVIAEIKSGLK